VLELDKEEVLVLVDRFQFLPLLFPEENLSRLVAQVFKGPDALPITRPMVTRHHWKLKALTTPIPSSQSSSFLHPPPDSRHKWHWFPSYQLFNAETRHNSRWLTKQSNK